jgi:hypothetical protein
MIWILRPSKTPLEGPRMIHSLLVSSDEQHNGTFTLGVRDSSVESLLTVLVILDLNILIMKILC